ncbi:efflux RND transporter periplasmic adaptor subunit [Haloflavibacter putidus]|uniref:Efflux RND transporter periplasmic adaptor subunit n=1 Tax=Haloflavibacter putidus TaxID=2576776 RepID=A0A507ZPF0_9FLAO|nr:efflux RND transporter periplasmic adaptor subunit [Haloflavibacter putidus]TQD39636.1 efflux RND transporter periplasmic adaptor subunit [Haloflavibacter putidus]
MKRILTIVILVVIVLAFGASMYYLYQKNQESPVVFKTEKPSNKTIIKETVATGSIVPKEEILIKPNISGIIDKIYIEAGDSIQSNDLIAQLRVVPNVSNLASSKNQITSAKIALDNETKSYNRQQELYEKGVISANEFDKAEVAYQQAQQTYKAAKQTYEIIKTGTSAGLDNAANTQIRSTISGMVLEVPVKEGNQVIEANNFNEGTTIAALANVDNMIFEGKVDESEVGKIKEGLPLEITVGAIENKKFDAILDYIAPKGVDENGAIQFEIEGTLKNRDTTFIRTGLSANASIILAKAEDVLAIKEALVQFDKETKEPFVEVKTGEQEFERRDIELGISDGLYVEVLNGLDKDDEVKIWNPVKPATNFKS